MKGTSERRHPDGGVHFPHVLVPGMSAWHRDILGSQKIEILQRSPEAL